MLDRRTMLGSVRFAAVAGLASVALPTIALSFPSETVSVDVDEYGASVNNQPKRNLAAFRAAIAAIPSGGQLVVSARGRAPYLIDTSGGLSQALKIDRPMTILLQGDIRATDGISCKNPPYLFHVSAADVLFTGRGSLAGPGYVDDTNMQDDTAHAGLVYVTGDRFRFVGPTVYDVPKIGIHLWNCRRAMISARWFGGIKDYVTGHTGLFGIRATGGGGHHIVSNRFERDDRDRRLITGYFTGGLMGGTTGDEIVGNVADVHEKIAYLFTSGSRIYDCSVRNAMQTDVVRVIGSGNVVERITGKQVKGGVSIYNGSNNVVRGCTFSDVYQAGIFVSSTASYAGEIVDVAIADNIITASSASSELQDGVCVYSAMANSDRISIEDNRVDASGKSAWRNCIRVEAAPPYFAKRPIIRDNAVSAGVNGLYLRRLVDGTITHNKIAQLRGGGALLRVTS